MKKTNILFTAILGVLFIVFHSCDKDDSDTKWGKSKIYMPQASILNGGLSNEYPVPFNSDPINKNYEFDSISKVLKIGLGVYRSGLETLEGFSVKVQVDIDASNIAAQNTNRGLVLPAETYSLPSEISVENGERQNSFFLTVDLKKLVDTNPGNASKRLILVVSLSNPSKYELNDKLSKTTIIINASSMLGKLNLIKGGDMAPGSEQSWKILSLILDNAGKIEITDGVMNFTNTGTANTGAYQAFDVEKGIEYVLKADMTSTAVSSTTYIMYLGQREPIEFSDYETGQYLAFWTFGPDGCLFNPKAGNIAAIACARSGIAADGTFKAEETGKLYVVFKAQSWGSIGKITIDNVSIKEKN